MHNVDRRPLWYCIMLIEDLSSHSLKLKDVKMSELTEDLKAVRELLTLPEKWCQGYLEKENSFCLLGALIQVTAGDTSRRVCAKAFLQTKLPVDGRAGHSIINWNDAEGRTHAEVLEMLDKTISSLDNPSLSKFQISFKEYDFAKERILEDA